MRMFLRSRPPVAKVSEAAATRTDPKRRRLLLTLGVRGAGAAAATIAALPVVAATTRQSPISIGRPLSRDRRTSAITTALSSSRRGEGSCS